MIRTIDFVLETAGHCDVHDITSKLGAELGNSRMVQGQILIFVPGSTAGVTTVEFEPGLVRDLNEFFEGLIPEGRDYHHHATWGDDNGSSHVRAALIGPSLIVPFTGGRLLLGTWQQVVVVDFDTRPRRRTVVVQLTGEAAG
jgi:secondary thiamine-phosphate synthase enzyme